MWLAGRRDHLYLTSGITVVVSPMGYVPVDLRTHIYMLYICACTRPQKRPWLGLDPIVRIPIQASSITLALTDIITFLLAVLSVPSSSSPSALRV
jgi:hypothetical protein